SFMPEIAAPNSDPSSMTDTAKPTPSVDAAPPPAESSITAVDRTLAAELDSMLQGDFETVDSVLHSQSAAHAEASPAALERDVKSTLTPTTPDTGPAPVISSVSQATPAPAIAAPSISTPNAPVAPAPIIAAPSIVEPADESAKAATPSPNEKAVAARQP